jgi:hypothetical protein
MLHCNKNDLPDPITKLFFQSTGKTAIGLAPAA